MAGASPRVAMHANEAIAGHVIKVEDAALLHPALKLRFRISWLGEKQIVPFDSSAIVGKLLAEVRQRGFRFNPLPDHAALTYCGAHLYEGDALSDALDVARDPEPHLELISASSGALPSAACVRTDALEVPNATSDILEDVASCCVTEVDSSSGAPLTPPLSFSKDRFDGGASAVAELSPEKVVSSCCAVEVASGTTGMQHLSPKEELARELQRISPKEEVASEMHRISPKGEIASEMQHISPKEELASEVQVMSPKEDLASEKSLAELPQDMVPEVGVPGMIADTCGAPSVSSHKAFPESTPPYGGDANISWSPEFGLPEFSDLSQALEAIEWPESSSRKTVHEGPTAKSFTLGLTKVYRGGSDNPDALKLSAQHRWNWGAEESTSWRLTALVTALVKRHRPDFEFTSVQVNGPGFRARLHTDKHNMGPSLIVGVGEYSGGEVWLYSEDGIDPIPGGVVRESLGGKWATSLPLGSSARGTLFDCRKKFQEFDGTVPHMTSDYTGVRYTLVYFCNDLASLCPPCLHRTLVQLGFRMPCIGCQVESGGEGIIADLMNYVEQDVTDSSQDDAFAEDSGKNHAHTTDSTSQLCSQHAREDSFTCCGDPLRLQDRIIAALRHKLQHDDAHTSLWSKDKPDAFQFGGDPILVHGLAQLGKSEEIARAAWLANFVYGCPVYLFVKNFGGREAKRQLKESLRRFNETKVNRCLQDLGVAAKDWKKYHCIPKEEYEEMSGDKQVVLKLTNGPDADKALREIQMFRNCEKPPVGILDESDLAVQTETSDRCRTEVAMRKVLDELSQVIYVTATPFANAYTEKGPGRVTELPIKPVPGGSDDSLVYYGISRRVPKERRPKHIPVDVSDPPEGCLPEGLVKMVEDMFSKSWRTVGLVHAWKKRAEHDQAQLELAKLFRGQPLLILVHDGHGGGKCTSWGGLMATESFEGRAMDFFINKRRLMEKACVSQSPTDARLHFTKKHKSTNDQGSAMDVPQVLTEMRKLMELEETSGRALPRLVIISGHLGNRGTTFRDENHDLHLTHLFAGSATASSSGEHMVQMMNRLSGLYNKDQSPSLEIWTSDTIMKLTQHHSDAIESIVTMVRNHPELGLKEVVKLYNFEDVIPELLHEKSATKLTREAVQGDFGSHRRTKLSNFRIANLPPLGFGGDMTTRVVSSQGSNCPVEEVSDDKLRSIAADCFGHERIRILDEVQTIPKAHVAAFLESEAIRDHEITYLLSCRHALAPEKRGQRLRKELENQLGGCIQFEHLVSGTRHHSWLRYPAGSQKAIGAKAALRWDPDRERFVVVVRKYVTESDFEKIGKNAGEVWVLRGFRHPEGTLQVIVGETTSMTNASRSKTSINASLGTETRADVARAEPQRSHAKAREGAEDAQPKPRGRKRRCGECANCLKPSHKQKCLTIAEQEKRERESRCASKDEVAQTTVKDNAPQAQQHFSAGLQVAPSKVKQEPREAGLELADVQDLQDMRAKAVHLHAEERLEAPAERIQRQHAGELAGEWQQPAGASGDAALRHGAEVGQADLSAGAHVVETPSIARSRSRSRPAGGGCRSLGDAFPAPGQRTLPEMLSAAAPPLPARPFAKVIVIEDSDDEPVCNLEHGRCSVPLHCSARSCIGGLT